MFYREKNNDLSLGGSSPPVHPEIAQHGPPPCKSTKKPTPYQIKTTTLLLDLGEPSRSPQPRGRRWSWARRAEPEAAGRGGGAAASGGPCWTVPGGAALGAEPGGRALWQQDQRLSSLTAPRFSTRWPDSASTA